MHTYQQVLALLKACNKTASFHSMTALRPTTKTSHALDYWLDCALQARRSQLGGQGWDFPESLDNQRFQTSSPWQKTLDLQERLAEIFSQKAKTPCACTLRTWENRMSKRKGVDTSFSKGTRYAWTTQSRVNSPRLAYEDNFWSTKNKFGHV